MQNIGQNIMYVDLNDKYILNYILYCKMYFFMQPYKYIIYKKGHIETLQIY